MAGKPSERFQETIQPYVRDRYSDPNPKDRAYQKTVRNDSQGDFKVGIKDIDESIVFYFDNVIQPSVVQKGERKKVPVIYGNQERWKAVQSDGYYRDKNGKIQAPLIMFRREGLEKNRNLSNKIDAENPQNFYVFKRKYSQKNFYDRFSALTNRKPVEEYQGVVIPDYVTLTYSCIIFTDYIEQNNKIIEGINYASDSYWGDASKFKFRASIDNYTTTTDIAQGQDRITKTAFTITLNGYIIPDTINAQLQGNRKFYSKSQVLFGVETATNVVDMNRKVDTSKIKKATKFYDQAVDRSTTSELSEAGMTTAQIEYLTLNSTAVASSINVVSHFATFGSKTIATPPDGFTLGQEAFSVYINNTYIPNSQRTVAQSGSDIRVTFDTNELGYLLLATDEIVLVGKFE